MSSSGSASTSSQHLLDLLGGGAAGAERLEEGDHPAQGVVARPVEAPVNGVLHARTKWPERGRGDEGRPGRCPGRPATEQRARAASAVAA